MTSAPPSVFAPAASTAATIKKPSAKEVVNLIFGKKVSGWVFFGGGGVVCCVL
jgi:hypothetical protein